MLKSHKGVDTQTEMPKCKGLLNGKWKCMNIVIFIMCTNVWNCMVSVGCTSPEGLPRRGDRRPSHKLDCTGMFE